MKTYLIDVTRLGVGPFSSKFVTLFFVVRKCPVRLQEFWIVLTALNFAVSTCVIFGMAIGN